MFRFHVICRWRLLPKSAYRVQTDISTPVLMRKKRKNNRNYDKSSIFQHEYLSELRAFRFPNQHNCSKVRCERNAWSSKRTSTIKLYPSGLATRLPHKLSKRLQMVSQASLNDPLCEPFLPESYEQLQFTQRFSVVRFKYSETFYSRQLGRF